MECRRFFPAVWAALALALAVQLPAMAQDEASPEELEIAGNIATFLQSARTVISRNQNLINDPDRGDKGLTGAVVLEEALVLFEEAAGFDLAQMDISTYEGRLMKAMTESVVEVMDDNQETINTEGLGFKGFIPATFARLVTEAFGRHIDAEEASVKVTAPEELVRNRQARPDDWELAAIREYLQDAEWPKGQIHSGIDDSGKGPSVRIMVPEYYVESCLTCHGKPAGEVDISGFPKEGADLGDLGGVISIRLLPQ